MRRLQKAYQEPMEFTGGMLLPDGRMVELIRDTRDGLARLALVEPEGKDFSLENQIRVSGTTYQPLDEPREWIRAVRLPKTIVWDTTAADLFGRLCDIYAPLGDDPAKVLSAWTLGTWVPEALPSAPLLQVSGPEAASVLRALELVCRRSVLVAVDSALGTVPPLLQPTVLALTRSVAAAAKFLSSVPNGQLLWRGSKLVDQHFGRAIGYADDATPIRGALNLVADSAIDTMGIDAEKLQAELLGWRMRSCRTLCDPGESDPVLNNLLMASSEMPEVADEVRAAYLSLVQPMEDEEVLEEDEAVVAVLKEVVATPRPSVYVAEVARQAEKRLQAAGSYLAMSPRGAGEVLRRLGIATERLGAAGRGIRWTEQNLAKVKELEQTRATAKVATTPAEASVADDSLQQNTHVVERTTELVQ